MNITHRISGHFEESARLQEACAELLSPVVAKTAELLAATFLNENKVLICGNGGSAALAQHLSAYLLHRFDLDRPGLPAICLSSDNATLTAIANDTQFDQIFAKQVQALGQKDDVLLIMSIGGNSPNILQAIRAAHDREMQIVALTGGDGGDLLELLRQGDIHIGVPHEGAARVQEIYLLILHAMCDAIDSLLLGVE